MSKHNDIDSILLGWKYNPGTVSARLIKAADGREVLQMRVEMGLLQLETSKRPDGEHPSDMDTFLEYLVNSALYEGRNFELSEDDCMEVDREFLQFHHRRICWLALRKFRLAVYDADHTLMLMDFCSAHSTDDQWVASHEQYRPFVLFQRTQAAALAELDEYVVGFMVYELNKTRLHILNFAVAPDFRHHGVGSQMLNKLIGKLSAQRRSRIMLEVRETNLAAQLFFRENGFRAVSVLREYYEDTPEDAYLMQYRYRVEKTQIPEPANRIARLAG